VDFREAILADSGITKHLTSEEIEGCFDYAIQLQHIEAIFSRVFEDVETQ
jgi:hypothetical protein